MLCYEVGVWKNDVFQTGTLSSVKTQIDLFNQVSHAIEFYNELPHYKDCEIRVQLDVRCDNCSGTGKVRKKDGRKKNQVWWMQKEINCPDCSGVGVWDKEYSFFDRENNVLVKRESW